MEEYATALSRTNIALIKYWGKLDRVFLNFSKEVPNGFGDAYAQLEKKGLDLKKLDANSTKEIAGLTKLKFPNKSTISFCVEGVEEKSDITTIPLTTVTTVYVSSGEGQIEFYLNGEKVVDESKKGYVIEFFELANSIFPDAKNYNYRIVSKNNFPTSAGFASSAAGFSALALAFVGAMSKFDAKYKEYLADKKLSALARLGSGSAARSISNGGGAVLWKRLDPTDSRLYKYASTEDPGEREKIRNEIIFDSYTQSIIPPEQLNELRVVYVKVSKKEKKVKSRAGMKQSVETDPLYWDWINYEESALLPHLYQNLIQKNYSDFYADVMKASNGLHSTALRTTPPIIYLNDESRAIIDAILELNEKQGENIAAYTFDAGPNAVIFTTDKYLDSVLDSLEQLGYSRENEKLTVAKVSKGAELIDAKLEKA